MEPTPPTPVAVPTKATKTPVAPQPLPVQPPVTTVGNEGGSKVLVVILSLLLLGALAAAGYFYYKAEEYKATISQREAEDLANRLPVAESILPPLGDDVASPTEYEKSLVQGYLEAHPVSLKATESNSSDVSTERKVSVLYYDEKTALIYDEKTAFELQGLYAPRFCIYDVRTFEQLGDNNNCLMNPQNYFRDYLFEVNSNHIRYYKKGSLSFKPLTGFTQSNQSAELDKNETYTATFIDGGIGEGGKDFRGEVTLNETTNELEVGVFDSRFTDNGSSTKRLRTAKFLLP